MTPTVSAVQAWRPLVLRDLADTWTRFAAELTDQERRLVGLDRDVFSGAAAQRAWQELDRCQGTLATAAACIQVAATALRQGADDIGEARASLLDLVASAHANGFDIADDGSVRPGINTVPEQVTAATTLTTELRAALVRVDDVDRAVALSVTQALEGSPAAPPTAGSAPPTAPAAADLVTAWPTMSQSSIRRQLEALSPEQSQALIEAAPQQVGNTDGVPWPLRVAANRLNITEAIAQQQQLLDQPEAAKIRAALQMGFDQSVPGLSGLSVDTRYAAILSDPTLRAAAVAAHDAQPTRRLDFYRSLLAPVPDPTHRDPHLIERQILAFDPNRSSLIELHGDLRTATSMAVLVPGMNTTVLDSASNAVTARRFVSEGRGDLAMVTYLGGPFPAGADLPGSLSEATNSDYAAQMAPRLVAFAEDVNRTVDGTGRFVPVTYLGHSYGGAILGTAEHLGLTADRAVYVEAAGAGIGVHDSDDWHNGNPDVERYSMTAPGDPIAWIQGLPGGPYGADPDDLAWRLPTGRRLDGSLMSGSAAHSDVLNEPSDAWRTLLDVITGKR